MSSTKSKGFDTVCIHGGHQKDAHRAHLTPIYASSTYSFDSAEHAADIFQGKEKAYVYGRFGNPTINEAEEKIAALESYQLFDNAGNPLQLKAILHASGMAAITTMFLSHLRAGDKIITHHSLYGGTQELLDKILRPLGMEAIQVDFKNSSDVEEAIKKNAGIKLMYIETPANPTLQCVDIAALTHIAKSNNLIVCADNTFATPFLQQPFRFGVDYIVHSTTKYLNGHGTAIGGILLGKDIERMNTVITKTHRLLGGNSNPFDAFLLTNGLRTLSVRMERHCANAEKIALFLASHPAIEKLNYLNQKTHPDYEICKKQMKHAGAVLSFELKGGLEAGKKFINQLALCNHAVSLGTCDTLISHPASTTHAGVSKEMRRQSEITDGLIRMSVGLENVEDIMEDLSQALKS